MRPGEQTGRHLLMAVIATVFSFGIGLAVLLLGWELWTLPLMGAGCLVIWGIHIGKPEHPVVYEGICAGLLLMEYFFFCVHETSLFDIPAMTGILVFALFSLNRKWILYATAALYVFALLYHWLVLGTISSGLTFSEGVRLLLGFIVNVGGMLLARFWIDQRTRQQKWFQEVFSDLKDISRQNAAFLSNVSHELRTPINMVIGISEVALGKDPSPEVAEDLSSIEMAGKRLSGQINNMLDYTEIVTGTLTPAKEEYMVTSVLNDVITSAALQSNRQGLELVFDIDPKTPAGLIGDAEKISHVLKILVENSVKFTEEGGVDVRIGFRQESYGINLIIDVEDTGIGMTGEQLDRMYQEFYQADTGARRFAGGLGLGLPIAKGILNSMGGFIHFDSDGKRGLHAHIAVPQGVADPRPCITLNNPGNVCVGCFFSPDRYAFEEVKGYYEGLIMSLMEGLGVNGYQAHNFEGLLKLRQAYPLTHVFIAQPQYEENPEYYEELGASLRVVVIAGKGFALGEGSKLSVIHKPFSALSVANLLNGELGERGFAEDQAAGRKPFTCVNVRALAVDDEEMNLVVAKGVLGSYGIQVDTCLSGREALARCEEASYDIVFLDHMMPGFDGVETLKRLREIKGGRYKNLPIIALTANTVSGAREMFLGEGFSGFIPKPIERTVLERVLRRVLPKSRIRYSDPIAKMPAPPPVPPQVPQREVQEPDPAPAPQADQEFSGLRLAGVDVELGLEYCGGDGEFFREMLRMFRDQAQEKQAELSELFNARDWPEYAVKAHALKSTSLTIGARDLSALAKELELAGKRGDGELIARRHQELLDAHSLLCHSLEAF